MRRLLGVVAGALCALGIACAAGGAKSMSAPPTAAAPAEMGRGSPEHAQIEQLDREITETRQKMGLGAQAVPVPPPVAPSCTGPGCAAEAATAMNCHPGASETCTSSCTFKDSICTNATKICELAKQLPGDAWASDKCNAGKASCTEATERCCACR